MKPSGLSRSKLSRLSDRELTDLWRETGKREYSVALLLNYLPFVYGAVSKYARDGASARTTVSEFAAAFPGTADGFTDSEPFSGQLYRELLLHISENADDTYGDRMEFLSKLSSGEEDAAAVFAEGRKRLTKPQRECIELFFLKGETFGYISENTGYLRQNIRSYIESGIAELIPAAAKPKKKNARPAPPSLEGFHTKFIQYIKDESSAPVSHEVEMRSMWDRFLTDALEGYEGVAGDHPRNLTELDREISAEVFPAANKNAGWIIGGAAALILVAAGFFIFGNGSYPDKKIRAKAESQRQSEVPAELFPSESETMTEPTAAAEPAVTAAATSDYPEKSMLPDGAFGSGIAAEGGKAAIVRISERSQGPAGKYVTVPEIGIKKYNEYLDKAVVKPADGWHGEVSLSFFVNKYGRPSRIRITEYLSQDAHREAIRLIENGPEWTPSDEEVTIVLKFE